MERRIKPLAAALALAVSALAVAALAARAAPKDVLEVAAVPSPLAVRSPLFAVARAGAALVAVGQRGHILVSDDGGGQWRQARVPVSADLTAVHFPSARHGWAVGHDGVILHSADGGRSWTKQLDGRAAAELIIKHYGARAMAATPTTPANPAIAAIVRDAERMRAEGPDQPLLNVWFENDSSGYALGAFNLILKTTDGGKGWTPAAELTDNPDGYHMYGVGASGTDVYIAGERGLLMKLDRAGARFIRLATPYQGSYFGVLARPGMVLAYGMRGNAWRSEDGGKSWRKIATGIQTALTAAAALEDGRIVLASQGGEVLVSTDDGRSFRPAPGIQGPPVFGIASAGAGKLALVGHRGARTARLD